MINHTSGNNKRIVKNTGLLYIRMLLLMFISLFTSRVVLQQLGVEDFGINNVVAGFVSMLAFFTTSLSNVVQRFLNFGLGKGDIKETTRYFNQSFTILLVISGIVVILGETLGLWFVSNKLVIPESRLSAAIWVCQFSILATVCSIIEVAFMGAIVAREKMNAYAYLGLFEAFARLGIAYGLKISPWDHLILFGFLTAMVSVTTMTFYVVYAKRSFPECECRLLFDKRIIGQMAKFMGANLFGCLAWSVGNQGITIILNLFFGPIVNAARGLAMQVSGAVMRFTDSIMTAIKPQIIKSYASKDYAYMNILVEKGSKFSFLLICFIAIPIIVECEKILYLWLGQVPDYAVAFTRLVIAEQMISIFITPLWIVANATGQIMRNQVYGRIFALAALPISYILLLFDKNPIYPMLILVFSNFGYFLYSLWDIHMQTKLDYKKYVCGVMAPSFIFLILLILIGFAISFIPIKADFVHVMFVTIVMDFCGLAALLVILSKQEREYIIKVVKTKLKRK